ncbi:MAG: copper chaperone PCu(A)C [Chloroflexota bacterium]
MFKVRFVLVFAVFAMLLAACSAAGSGEFQVRDAWARPGLAGGNSAVFFVIVNPGGADSLLSVSSEVAEAVELHMTMMQDGNMQMAHQMNVPVPTGETVFKPGGLHVMLIGLKDDLKAGDTFTVALAFEKAGEQTLTVTVKDQ